MLVRFVWFVMFVFSVYGAVRFVFDLDAWSRERNQQRTDGVVPWCCPVCGLDVLLECVCD